jgi:DNA modification methylase
MILFRFPTRKKDGSYDIDLADFAKRIMDSLNPSGWCVAYAYASIENKLRPFDLAAALRDVGLHMVDIVVINRPWWSGKKSDAHLALSHEYAIIFSKNSKWYLDRAQIYPVLTGDKYKDVSCPGSSWDLKKYNHNESYSAELSTAIMKMVGLLPGSVVFDPFMGGSSGIYASVACGHSFIGFETDQDQYVKYTKVLKKVKKQIDERDVDHAR